MVEIIVQKDGQKHNYCLTIEPRTKTIDYGHALALHSIAIESRVYSSPTHVWVHMNDGAIGIMQYESVLVSVAEQVHGSACVTVHYE